MHRKQNSNTSHRRNKSFSADKEKTEISLKSTNNEVNVFKLLEMSQTKQSQKVNIIDKLSNQDDGSTNPEIKQRQDRQKQTTRLRNSFLYPTYCTSAVQAFTKVGKFRCSSMRKPCRNKNKMRECRDPVSKNFSLMNQMADIEDGLQAFNDCLSKELGSCQMTKTLWIRS